MLDEQTQTLAISSPQASKQVSERVSIALEHRATYVAAMAVEYTKERKPIASHSSDAVLHSRSIALDSDRSCTQPTATRASFTGFTRTCHSFVGSMTRWMEQ